MLSPGSAWFRLQPVLYHPWFLAGVAVLNTAGAVWGFYWYKEQLAATPWPVWVFVPDCPLHAALFAVYAVWLRRGRDFISSGRAVLSWIAVLGAIKYGVWTVVIVGQYLLAPGTAPDFESVMLFISHAGMAAEGLAYLPALPRRGLGSIPALLWLMANDASDYFLFGTLPRLPLAGQFSLARGLALFLTAVAAAAALAQFSRQPPMEK